MEQDVASFDAVMSYHTNPFRCGVAKFSQQLAAQLGLRWAAYGGRAVHPLVSVKFSELGSATPDPTFYYRQHSLFVHDAPVTGSQRAWIRTADQVWTADPSITAALEGLHPHVTTAWCPALMTGQPTCAPWRIVWFGMAHKLPLMHLRLLTERLEGLDYELHVSTAVHEGHAWSETFERVWAAARQLCGDRARLLGYLGDDALLEALAGASAAALFFDPAVRANNTSAWSVLASGTPLITNLDAQSPPELVHGETVWEITRLQDRLDRLRLLQTSTAGRRVAQARGWAALTALVGAGVHA